MIAARGVSKWFGRLKALDDFSATLEPGRAYSLIGPNGSGKTTFIKCLLGLVLPDAGDLELDGTSLLGNPMGRAQIGYMPQTGRFPENMRVGQVFDMMMEIRRGTWTRLDEDLKTAFEIGRIERKPMRTLSGGTRQKVSACLAFLFTPEVLVLDEPTAGLDPVAVEILKEKVITAVKSGKTVLLTSHILSDLDEITTDVLYLMEGKLRFNRPIDELKAESGEDKLGKLMARIMRDSAANLRLGDQA